MKTTHVFLACLLFALTASAAPRVRVSLNGTWDVAVVPSLDQPPPDSAWKAVEVPGLLIGGDYERAWFRRRFEVPAEWQGRRILLHFGGIKYNSRVLVNGQPVGGCFNGYDAFELDITASVNVGAQNELRVGTHNWTGIFSDGPHVDFHPDDDWLRKREIPKDRVLGPIGGRYDRYGIWDDVTLLSVPAVHVARAFFRPSVRRSRLAVDVTVTNAGADLFQGPVTARWFRWEGAPRGVDGQWAAGGDCAAQAEAQPLRVAAGNSSTITLETAADGLATWWPSDPVLYILEIRCGDDVWQERVGYRELWIEGPDFVFNGRKTHLLATSWWPYDQALPAEDIAGKLRAIKAMNAVCFRTHTQPWRRRWYETADEVGLMMVPEGAVWNDDAAYRVDDPAFWKHYGDHLVSMVRHLRNHPSVVMWSLENEFYGTRAKDDTPVEQALAQLGELVKSEDPTRPITYESDGDPGGVADVIGLHYPNEAPERRLWPNDAYWMDEARTIHGGGGMFWDDRPFFWNREKPLYIGEYLWMPARSPAPLTLFFGDLAYTDYQQYRTLAKAMVWRMQMQAYRHYGVSGHSPWTVEEHGPLNEENPLWTAQRDLYRPLAAFVKEADTRFFAGETVTRTVEVLNDTLANDLSDVTLQWRLADDKTTVARGSTMLNLAAGTQATRTLQLALPSSGAKRSYRLLVTLATGGEERFREEWPIVVSPRRSWKMPGAPLAVFDPDGALLTAWKGVGAGITVLSQPEDWSGEGVLVIGRAALRSTAPPGPPAIGGITRVDDALAQRVRQGGRVLLLEQEPDAGAWLPVHLTDQSSTLAYPLIANHPALRGMQESDLRFWRGDNQVSRNEPERPTCGAMRAIVGSGTGQGLTHAPILEIPDGAGVWLVCQLQVVSKLGTEPVAQPLLENMLAYLAEYEGASGHTVCLGPEALQSHLTRLGVEWTPIEDFTTLDPKTVGLLVMQSDAAGLASGAPHLKRYIESGGTVLWHRPDPKSVAAVTRELGVPLEAVPYPGPVQRAEGNDPLIDGITREDLYWLDRAEGTDWQRTERATGMTDVVFAPPFEPTGGKIHEAEQNVSMEGHYVRTNQSEVVFATAGSAHWTIELPADGPHILGITARGTPVGDMYPLADVLLDQRRIGQIYAATEAAHTYSLPFSGTAGRHSLTITFTNDKWAPPQDRNLYIDRFTIAAASEPLTFVPFTIPAALGRLRVGKGSLILNSVRWDEAGGNVRKAQRFACSLLTGLGARFRSRAGDVRVEAESMEPRSKMNWFRREADHVFFADGGTIGCPIRVNSPGRYRISAWAKGTAVDDEYPVIALALDGDALGRIECRSDDWAPHFLDAELSQGEAVLTLEYVNDLYQPPDDRNLWLDRLEFERLE